MKLNLAFISSHFIFHMPNATIYNRKAYMHIFCMKNRYAKLTSSIIVAFRVSGSFIPPNHSLQSATKRLSVIVPLSTPLHGQQSDRALILDEIDGDDLNDILFHVPKGTVLFIVVQLTGLNGCV